MLVRSYPMLYKIHHSVPSCAPYFNCLRLAYHALKCRACAHQWVNGERLAANLCPGYAQDYLQSPNAPSHGLTNQQAVSITVEAVARVDRVFVGRQDVLSAGKCADQRQQRGTRQMKVCE